MRVRACGCVWGGVGLCVGLYACVRMRLCVAGWACLCVILQLRFCLFCRSIACFVRTPLFSLSAHSVCVLYAVVCRVLCGGAVLQRTLVLYTLIGVLSTRDVTKDHNFTSAHSVLKDVNCVELYGPEGVEDP